MKAVQKRINGHPGGLLDLAGCDLCGVTLPTTFSGSLDLRGCDLKGVTLPTTMSGWLDLRGCDLKGVTLPTTVGGSIYLRGCDLKGVTLPTTVGDWLNLRGCGLKGVTLPTVMFGKPGRAIAFDGEYLLWAADDGTYSAGCAKHISKEEALRRWDRKDERAVMFTKAILEAA